MPGSCVRRRAARGRRSTSRSARAAVAAPSRAGARVFDHGAVRIETLDGEVLESRRDPRRCSSAAPALRRNLRWDALDAHLLRRLRVVELPRRTRSCSTRDGVRVARGRAVARGRRDLAPARGRLPGGHRHPLARARSSTTTPTCACAATTTRPRSSAAGRAPPTCAPTTSRSAGLVFPTRRWVRRGGPATGRLPARPWSLCNSPRSRWNERLASPSSGTSPSRTTARRRAGRSPTRGSSTSAGRRFPGAHMAIALWLTRGAHKTFPVLQLDGRNIGDSTAIIAALETRWPERAAVSRGSRRAPPRARARGLLRRAARPADPPARLARAAQGPRADGGLGTDDPAAVRDMGRPGGRVRPHGAALPGCDEARRSWSRRSTGSSRARWRRVPGRRPFSVADLTAASLYPIVNPPEGPPILPDGRLEEFFGRCASARSLDREMFVATAAGAAPSSYQPSAGLALERALDLVGDPAAVEAAALRADALVAEVGGVDAAGVEGDVAASSRSVARLGVVPRRRLGRAAGLEVVVGAWPFHSQRVLAADLGEQLGATSAPGVDVGGLAVSSTRSARRTRRRPRRRARSDRRSTARSAAGAGSPRPTPWHGRSRDRRSPRPRPGRRTAAARRRSPSARGGRRGRPRPRAPGR